MAGYLIANLDVHDPDMFAKYRDQVTPLIARFGGRYLIRGGELEHVEGHMPVKRLVVLEFPTLDAARTFYESPDYESVLPLRLQSTHSEVALVEGYAG
ncbi:MAG: DUF1330 domain-containing protein [Rhizobiales bacterium]|nr:DUF1330 domain-containing protein [Hyphomicrobiales bacterium]